MNTKRGAAPLRWLRGLACLALAGVLGLPGLVQASPGCVALNGQSGTIAGYGYVQLLTNSQPVNQGDYVTLTTSGQIFYGGSFLQMSANNSTVSGTEGGSGVGADNLSNAVNSPATYSVTCGSAGASISGVSPSSATAGSSVVISGSGFWGATQVLFGATPATAFTVNYSGGTTPIINATVPNGSGTVAITVITDAGTYSGGSFTFTAPTANAVNATVAYGSSNNAIALSITGTATSVAVASVAAHGTATASGTSISYTPTAGYSGSDSFTYTATNVAGTSAPATVSITVNAVVPGAPTIGAATAGNAQATVSFTPPASNGGSAITGYTVTSSPGGITGSGASAPITLIGLTNGTAYTFTVTATNNVGTGAASAASNSVTPLAAPTAAAKSVTTAYNTVASIDLSGSITGTGITAVTIGTAPTHGTVSVSGEVVTYTPSSTYYGGSDSFTYTATNPGGTSSAATVTITVGAPAVPTVAAKSVSTAYNTAASIDLSGSISGVDITAVTIGTSPTHGTVSVSGEVVTYTPSPTYYGGSDSFTYTATNPGGTSVPATVTITVGAPTAPTAAAKSVTTAYNTAASIDLTSSITGVDITAVTIGTAPTHGTVSVSGETVTYTPSPTYYGGSDSFTYTVTNPGGTSTAATVTITVGVPAAPTATAKAVSTAYNTAASIDLTGSITGVDITAVTIGAAPAHGTASVSGETVTYTPSSTYYGGSDSFTYTVTNPGGTSSAATVTITVGAPAVPIVAAKSVTTAYNTAASIDLISSISGVDITGVTIGTAPMHGTVSVSGETVTYTPSPTYYGGSDSFTYTATNPGGTSSAATVSVTVTPLSVPVAKPLAVVTLAGEPVLVQAWAGATGPQPFTGAGVITQPSHGSASASGGQITYVPVAGFTGSDTFGYEVINSFGHSLPATVTVTVLPAGSATGSSVTLTTTPGTPVSTNLATIVPGSYVSSTLVGMSPANAGNVALSQPSTLTFSPAPGFHGLVQLSAALVSANSSVISVNVLVLVSSQPDPSKNPNVLGLINAQTEQAQRFAQSQLDNIHGRLESLHDGGGTASFSNSLSISLDGRPLQAPRSAASDGTEVPGGHPLADGNGWGMGTSNAWMRPGIGASEGVADASTTAGKPVDTDSDTASRGSGGLGAWVGGTAAFGAFDAYRQAAGFDADSIAVNVGVDQRIGQRSLVGFSLGYNHDNSTIANDGTRSIAHGYSAAFYGSFQPVPQTYIDAVLGGGKLTFDSRRHDSDSGSFLSGQRDGKQWFASLTAGYEYHKDNWLVSPYGRLEWSLSTLDGFSENGTPASALIYGNQTVRTSLAVLGLRASGQVQLSYGMLIPHARLEVGHDFQGTGTASLSYAFIPSAGSWNVLTNPYSANGTSAQLGLGLDLQLAHDLRLSTDYEYLTQPHARVQMIRLGVSKQF